MTKKKSDGSAPRSNKKAAAKAAAEHLRGKGAKPGDAGALNGDVDKTQGVLRSIGDNGPKDSDFRTHMLTIIGFKSKVETANGYLQNAYKRAQEAGIDTKAIKQAIVFKKKTTDDIVAFLSQLSKCFKAAEINLPVQEEMFGGELNRQAIIFQEGFDLGSAAKDADEEKYPPSSPEGQIHMHGWHAGQASITKIGKTPAPKVDSLGVVN